MGTWLDIPPALGRIEDALAHTTRRLSHILITLESLEETMSAAIDRLKAAVEADRSVTASVLTLLADLTTRLKDAAAAGDLTEVQTIAAEIEANNQTLADAVTANTPAATPTTTQEPSP